MSYTPKTTATSQKAEAFLASVSEKRQHEATILIAMMQRVSGEAPVMWGPSMIGFGKFHYVTKSKSEADWFKIGFSPREAKLSLYLTYNVADFADDLAKLGKHTHGKGCLYVNKLEDVDLTVLEEIVRQAFAATPDKVVY